MPQPDSTNRQTMHYRARKHRKSACERCAATIDLEVHHRDEDRTNNDPANLETLCGKCHRAEHGVGPMVAARRERAKTQLSSKQRSLLAVVKADWLTAEVIAERLGTTISATQNSLLRLRARDFVERRPSGLKGPRQPRWEWKASDSSPADTSSSASGSE